MDRNREEDIIKVPRFEESAGFYTTPQRSRTMSKIRGKDTKPEMRFRKALWHAGFRYRTKASDLPGKPDISNKSRRIAIFIDGGFWHGYDWENKRGKIKSNRKFWLPKIERNMQRDKHVNLELKRMGFRVFRFWDHQIKNELGVCIKSILDEIHQ